MLLVRTQRCTQVSDSQPTDDGVVPADAGSGRRRSTAHHASRRPRTPRLRRQHEKLKQRPGDPDRRREDADDVVRHCVLVEQDVDRTSGRAGGRATERFERRGSHRRRGSGVLRIYRFTIASQEATRGRNCVTSVTTSSFFS